MNETFVVSALGNIGYMWWVFDVHTFAKDKVFIRII